MPGGWGKGLGSWSVGEGGGVGVVVLLWPHALYQFPQLTILNSMKCLRAALSEMLSSAKINTLEKGSWL